MPKVDLLVYDESHHCASASYRKLTTRARELNPNVKIYGVTATPERSDKKGLKDTFTNIADIVTVGELVRAGNLVPPVGMVIDIGTQQQLEQVDKTGNEYDMGQVEAIQNSVVNNNAIVRHWKEHASDRPTTVFCATIQHAMDVCEAFRDAGIPAEAVHSKLTRTDRRAKLAAFDRGDFPVLCNPLLLTEGWDSQRCACIMLLRISSHKSTVIQMIGRGLRKVDPVRYPGVVKKDCLILDFGISLRIHGDINAVVDLKFDRIAEDQKRTKLCPECKAEMPIQAKECLFCGYQFRIQIGEDGFYNELAEFKLIEIDLIGKSPFRWMSLFPSERVLVATGFSAWASVVSTNGEDWFAIGGGEGRNPAILGISNKIGAISTADDYMRRNETNSTSKKASAWMADPASPKQLQMLSKIGRTHIMSKVEAAANLTFYFNQRKIEHLIGVRQ